MKVMLFLVVVGIFSAPSLAECTYPKAPEKLPDGSVATLEEMRSAQKAVKDYDKGINAYLACITLEHNSAVVKGVDTLTPEKREEMARAEIKKHNAAIDELEAIAARFNEQVRIFKARKNNG